MIRILIVEDEKPIANLIDWNLSDCGYQCVSVNDGIAAADKLFLTAADLRFGKQGLGAASYSAGG